MSSDIEKQLEDYYMSVFQTDGISSSEAQNTVRDLSAQMSILRAEQQINVVDPIGYYIAYPDRSTWEGVQNNLTCTL